MPFADWAGASWRERSVGRMAGQWQTGAVRLGVEGLAIAPGRDWTGFPRANAVADAK